MVTTTPGAPECFKVASAGSNYASAELFDAHPQQDFEANQEEVIGDLISALPDRLVAHELWP